MEVTDDGHNKVRPDVDRGDRRSPRGVLTSTASVFSYFVDNTTFHGLPRIFGAPLLLEKVFWILAFFTCLGTFIYQGTTIINDYKMYPYATKTDIITVSSVHFPAVTVCNVNMMRRSKILGTRFEDLIELDGQQSTGTTDDYSFWFEDSFYERLFDNTSFPGNESASDASNTSDMSSFKDQQSSYDYDFSSLSWEDNSFDFSFYDAFQGVTGDNPWAEIYNQSKSPDFSNLRATLNPTQAELQEYGHQPEDFILQCSFDRRPCSYRNFSMFQHSKFGNCFTFNGRTVDEPRNKTVRTGRTGANNGLQLTLFVEQPETIGLLAAESGVKVSIHSPTAQPFPEDDGLTVSTGQKTIIGLRTLNISRLGGRYGDKCTKAGEGTNFTSDTFSYTTNACMEQCLQNTLQKSCRCITDIRFSNFTQCDALDTKQEMCRQLVEYLYQTSSLRCSCPIACSEDSYIRSVSSSLWPSARFEKHLAQQLVRINSKIEKIITDEEKTRQNVVNVVVYFEQLNYELNQQVPVYSLESLLGTVGGLLGLYLGMSFMTTGEFIVLLFGLIRVFGRRVLCSSCNRPEVDNDINRPSKSQFTQRTSDIDEYDKQSDRSSWYRCLVVSVTLVVCFITMAVIITLVLLFELGVISINVK